MTDELLKAITSLISTGGDLANDALYLYFIMKILGPWSATMTVVGTVWMICRTILKFHDKG